MYLDVELGLEGDLLQARKEEVEDAVCALEKVTLDLEVALSPSTTKAVHLNEVPSVDAVLAGLLRVTLDGYRAGSEPAPALFWPR